MAKILSDKAATVLAYLQANQGTDITTDAIAEALDMEKRSVVGTLTGLQKETKTHPGLIKREEKEGVDGKVIVLTAEGAKFDPAAEKAEAAE